MVDWDVALGYSTIKVVKVLDRRLGALRYLFMIAIFFYVIVWVIIVKKGYLKEEVPMGNVEVSLEAPRGVIDPAQFKYCAQFKGDNKTRLAKGFNSECYVMDALEVRYPHDALTDMFITTRIGISEFTRVCEYNSACEAPYKLINKATNAFVADVENFTIRVRHSMEAVEFYKHHGGDSGQFAAVSGAMEGSLLRLDGSVLRNLAAEQADIFKVSELLEAASTVLDDESDAVGAEGTSMRDSGVVLLVFIEYTNRDTEYPVYTFRVNRVPYSEYKILQPEPLNRTTQRQYNRHGIKAIFIQSGTIGAFDFQTLLVQLVSALGLLAIASTIVDQIMLNFAPHKKSYAKAKFESTKDFSDFDEIIRGLRANPSLKGISKDRLIELANFAYDQRVQRALLVNHAAFSSEEIRALRAQIDKNLEVADLNAEQQRKKVWNLLDMIQPEQAGSLTLAELRDLLVNTGAADKAIEPILSEVGVDQTNLNEAEVTKLMIALGRYEQIRIASGDHCARWFSPGAGLSNLIMKLENDIKMRELLPHGSAAARRHSQKQQHAGHPHDVHIHTQADDKEVTV